MSAIIQKLNALNKLDITLPICKESLQINKINLETQAKFEEFGRNTENELYTSSQYIQFINTHIKKEVKNRLKQIYKSKIDAAIDKFVQYTLTQEIEINRFE